MQSNLGNVIARLYAGEELSSVGHLIIHPLWKLQRLICVSASR